MIICCRMHLYPCIYFICRFYMRFSVVYTLFLSHFVCVMLFFFVHFGPMCRNISRNFEGGAVIDHIIAWSSSLQFEGGSVNAGEGDLLIPYVYIYIYIYMTTNYGRFTIISIKKLQACQFFICFVFFLKKNKVLK